MTVPSWAVLAPAGILGSAALLALLVDTIAPDGDTGGLLAAVAGGGGLAALATAVWFLLSGVGRDGPVELFDGNLVVDGPALLVTAVVAAVVVLVALASYDRLAGRPDRAEYYSLLLLSATGMALVAVSNSFAVAFVSLELVSLPAYVLVAWPRSDRSVEGGLKFFVIGALSSAILAYGISLVYVSTGSLAFSDVAAAVAGEADTGILDTGLFGVAVLLVLGGFAFKMTVVPFHFWVPDAYEGGPTPVAAFLASASTAAGLVITVRVFAGVFPEAAVDWVLAVQLLAVVTMTLGNFAALRQDRITRMLAYSSVGHAGFTLVGLAALTGRADPAFALGSGLAHLLVYGFMNTGAFLVVALGEHWGLGRRVEDYAGLATRAPFVAVAMTVFLYSLAGLPVGGGFLSKLYLLGAALDSGVTLLVVAVVLNSVVSVFYYTRVVRAMWAEPASMGSTDRPAGLYIAVALALLGTVLVLPGFGVVAELAEASARQLTG